MHFIPKYSLPTTKLPIRKAPENSTIAAKKMACRKVTTFDPTDVPNYFCVE